jgi:hypothetical protein
MNTKDQDFDESDNARYGRERDTVPHNDAPLPPPARTPLSEHDERLLGAFSNMLDSKLDRLEGGLRHELQRLAGSVELTNRQVQSLQSQLLAHESTNEAEIKRVRGELREMSGKLILLERRVAALEPDAR